MITPIELTNTPKSIRKRIRDLLLAAPTTIVGPTAPVVAVDDPATIWFNDETGVAVLLYGGLTFPLGGGSGTLEQAYTESATPPDDTTLPWFDTVDQTWNAYDTENEVWVVTSGEAGPTGPIGATGPTGADSNLISDITGLGASAALVTNIVKISLDDYNAIIDPDPSTFYIIV